MLNPLQKNLFVFSRHNLVYQPTENRTPGGIKGLRGSGLTVSRNIP